LRPADLNTAAGLAEELIRDDPTAADLVAFKHSELSARELVNRVGELKK
jgi:hypothetical protein